MPIEEFSKVVDSVKEVFGKYVPRNSVEVYFPKERVWKNLVYRPVLMTGVDRFVEARAREAYGINFTPYQKSIAEKRTLPYADSELPGGEFFVAEGAFICSHYFSGKSSIIDVVHEFTHANLTGKMGIANEAAKEMVKFYKTGDFDAGKRSHDIFCKYHELNEAFARFAEMMFLDELDEGKELRRTFDIIKYHIKKK